MQHRWKKAKHCNLPRAFHVFHSLRRFYQFELSSIWREAFWSFEVSMVKSCRVHSTFATKSIWQQQLLKVRPNLFSLYGRPVFVLCKYTCNHQFKDTRFSFLWSTCFLLLYFANSFVSSNSKSWLIFSPLIGQPVHRDASVKKQNRLLASQVTAALSSFSDFFKYAKKPAAASPPGTCVLFLLLSRNEVKTM